MLFKTCGATNVAGTGFEERRDTAFSMLESGVVSNQGFYTTNQMRKAETLKVNQKKGRRTKQ
ncbi:hypothetical protein V6Z11_D10G234000 [Gossypium hirsutum]